MRRSKLERQLAASIEAVQAGKLYVYAATGERGRIVGERACTLEGCLGTRIGVRWPDGELTWPCTKGMEKLVDGWRILPA